jgi:hypothetical protein
MEWKRSELKGARRDRHHLVGGREGFDLVRPRDGQMQRIVRPKGKTAKIVHDFLGIGPSTQVVEAKRPVIGADPDHVPMG